MHIATRPPRLSSRQKDGLALLLILAVSLLFRVWQLDRFPPGLFGDEAVNGLDALDVLAGRPQVFFPANFGREGLHMLVLAPFIRWLGATALALRLPSAIAGTLTCLATYWLGRELVARTHLRGRLLPLLAALLLATSYWHVHFSRFGIRGVFTPLLATLAFAAFWHGANRQDSRSAWPAFLAAGAFLGLGVHFYTAGRLLPVFLGGFLLVQWLLGRRFQAPSFKFRASHPSLLSRFLLPVAGMYAVAALVFAPLGLYFLSHPGSFTQRAGAVSAFSAEVGGESPLAQMFRAGWANLLQFFVPGMGDQATFYNLPGRAVFDPLLAMLAIAGLLLCLRAAGRGSSPHLFLLLWFPAMLVPAVLAVDRFPTLPRALGVLPGVYFLPAVAVSELVYLVNRAPAPSTGPRGDPPAGAKSETERAGAAPLLALGLVLALVLWQGVLTWRDYFQRWGPAPATFDAFEGDMAAAAEWLAQEPGREAFLSSDIYRHPTFVFLHEQVPLTEFLSYQDPLVHFFDGRQSLPLPPAGQPATYLFTHNAGPDPLLDEAPGHPELFPMEEVAGPGGPALVVTTLGEDSAPDVQDGYRPVSIPFGPDLRLSGYHVQPLAGQDLALYLLWQMVAPLPNQPHGLQVQAGVQEPEADRQLSQASVELTYRATEWAPGSHAITWLQLPLADGLPSGAELALRLVDQATGLPLAPEGADENGWLLLPLAPE